jgi:hypothetical protein
MIDFVLLMIVVRLVLFEVGGGLAAGCCGAAGGASFPTFEPLTVPSATGGGGGSNTALDLVPPRMARGAPGSGEAIGGCASPLAGEFSGGGGTNTGADFEPPCMPPCTLGESWTTTGANFELGINSSSTDTASDEPSAGGWAGRTSASNAPARYATSPPTRSVELTTAAILATLFPMTNFSRGLAEQG